VLGLFALGTAAALAVAVVGGYVALRSVALDEAKRDTRTKVQEAGRLVELALAEGILTGDLDAIAAVDDLVLALQNGETLGYEDLSSGGMAAIQENLAQLPESDVRAISEYLLSLE